MSLQRIMTFGFWPSHYLWLLSRLLCWGDDSFPGGLFFFLNLPMDRSFEMTTDSSNSVSRVRSIRIILMLCQASWFSQMGCETLFYSWFDHSNSSAEHLLRPMESFSDHFSGLRVVATCHIGTYFPSSFLHSLAFKATISSRLWHSKPLFLFFSLAFKAIG